MSEVDELKKEISELKKKIDKNTEIGRAAHFQSKGRLTELEKGYSVLKDEIKVLQQERAEIEELKEKVINQERGLKNLWQALKELQSECDKPG